MSVGIFETISIARNAVGRLRLTRWQLTKLIALNIWRSFSFTDIFLTSISIVSFDERVTADTWIDDFCLVSLLFSYPLYISSLFAPISQVPRTEARGSFTALVCSLVVLREIFPRYREAPREIWYIKI